VSAPLKVDVLDHGFVRLCNLAGPTRRIWTEDKTQRAYTLEGSDPLPMERNFDADDRDPAQAARMSFEQFGSERTLEEDMKLSRYLLKNLHTSPFEMVQVWLEVKVPIFVDRQLVRHRTWRRNESSGRYIVLPDEWHIPEVVGGKPVGGAKQGQSDTLDAKTQKWFKDTLQMQCKVGYQTYLQAIEQGVANEEARLFLHLNHYVHWLGNVDLGNLFQFLALRAHSHAQKQAQAYAYAIIELLRPHLPELMKLFDELVKRP
jgi:thymidylate synthase (FAD)